MSTITLLPDEREAFEAFAREYGTWDIKRDDVPQLGIASYTDVAVVIAWHAWLARAELAATPAAGELAPLQVGLQEPAPVVLPEEIPASNTLWMFLTKGMTQSAIAGMPERDRKVLTERAQENWAAIRAEVGATAPVVLPEPVAYSLGLAKYAHSSNIIAANEFTPDAEHADEWENLYTETQVRALLAEVSAAAAHQKVGSYVTTSGELKPDVSVYAPTADARDARIYTYSRQPTDNVIAWRFGEACSKARPGGDYIDHGLSLLQQLQEKGYGITAILNEQGVK